jgi:hypothetical protein
MKTDRYGDIYFVDFNYGCVRKITNPVASVRNGTWSDPATWSNGKVPAISCLSFYRTAIKKQQYILLL